MKTIELSQGEIATVDAEDFERVSQFKWTYRKGRLIGNTGYAIRSYGPAEKRKYQFLHRFILNIIDSKIEIDHINGDGLDNRKSNLRPSSKQENMRNRNHSVLANSGFRGVYKSKEFSKRNKPWYARIRLDPGQNKHLGYFFTAEEAAKAFDKAAKELYGEFCGKLNFE